MAASLEELRSKLADNPADLDTLARLEAECVQAGDFATLRLGYRDVLAAATTSGEVVALITRLAAVAEEAGQVAKAPRDALELLLRAARLYSRAPISDREAAAKTLSTAWKLAPDPRVLDTAGTLLGDPDLAHAPEYLTYAHAQLVDDPGPSQAKSIDALHVLAGRHLDRLELERSRELYQRLIELRPEDARIKDGLAALEEVQAERKTKYEEASKAAAQAPKTGNEATAAWVAVGIAANRIGEAKATRDAYVKALAAGGEDSRLDRLESKVRAQSGGVEALIAAWTAELERLDSADHADPLSLEAESRVIAMRRKLYRALNELGRTDEATKLLTFERAVEPPTPTEALEEGRKLEEAGEYRAALELLGAAERGAPASNAVLALISEQARLLNQVLEKPAAAEPLYRRVRLADPRNLTALRFYREFYADKGDEQAREAYSALAQLFSALPPEEEHAQERLEVAAAMARRAGVAFDAPERALDAWRRVVHEDPANEEANEALKAAYTASERWHLLVEHLEAWAKALGDSTEAAIEKLFEVLEIYQDPNKLGQDELVVPTYRRIVALSPTSVRALDRLAKRYEADNKWRELIAVLQKKVEVAEDPGDLIKLFTKISRLYLERIHSPAQAIEWLERMLELDPGNLDIIHKLRDVYAQKHDTERLYGTYKRELELLDGNARKDVLVELGELATNQLFKHSEAIEHWKAVLELDPKHERATTALGELHAEQEDWPSYAELLKGKIDEAKTRKEKVELLQELGEIAYARLGDEERARKIFAEICEISPFNTKARSFLQKIYVARRGWDDLRALYAPREDWKGYVTLLGDIATKTDDADLTADIYVEIADVQGDKLDDSRRVISSLEHALEAVGERVDVARKLLELYPDNAPVAKRMAALQAVAAHTEDEAEAEQAYRDLATLKADHHDDPGAFDAWVGALTSGASLGHTDVLEPLTGLAEKLNRWQELADALSEALSRLPDSVEPARIAVHRNLASIARHRLVDTARAIAHYACVLQLLPADAEALDALEEMYLAEGNFGGLEDVLRARAALADNDDDRLAATLKLGELYDDALADAERAAECYQTILRARPDDEDVLDRLRATLTGAEAWGMLARSLEVLVVRAESHGQIAKARHELAKLYIERLGDPAAAIEEYRALLSMDEVPDEDAILQSLEKLFEEGTAATASAPLLEKLYRRKGDAHQLIRVLQAKAVSMPVGAERLAVLDEIALLASTTLDEPKVALKAQLQRFLIKPSDVGTWNELEALADRCDGHGLVAARWDAVLDKSQPDSDNPLLADPATRNQLRRRLAKMFELRFGAPDVRIKLYEALLGESEVEEDLTDVFEQLERLYEGKSELEKLVDIRLQAADAMRSPVARRQKLLDAATLMVTQLQRAEEAMPLYEQLAEADPSDEEATRALEGLYQSYEKYDALANLLRKRVGVLEGERRDEVGYQLASLLREQLDDPGAACTELCSLVLSESVGAAARASLLQLAKDDLLGDAQLDEALKALDAYHAQADDPLGKVEVVMLHAQQTKKGQPRARILRDAAGLLTEYAYAENQRLLAEAESRAEEEGAEAEVVEEADITDDDIASAAEVLDDESLQVVEVEAADVEEVAEQPAPMLPEVRSMADRAFAIYARALHEFPGDRETAEAIEELAARLGVWEKFARIMASVAPKANVPAVSFELWEREARAAEHHLGDPQRAIDAYNHIMDNAKASSKEALRALDALDRLYGGLGEKESRIRVLRMKRAAVKKPTMRLPLLGEEARLLHEMGRVDEALVALKAVLQSTASTQRDDMLDARKTAQQHLAQLLVDKGDDSKLLEFLLEGAQEYVKRDPAEARNRMYQAASLALDKMNDADRAIDIYERIRAFSPGDEVTLSALDSLYQKAQRWGDKASVLEERITHLPEDEAHSDEIRTARFTLGQLLEHRLGQPERSQEVYREVLEADPNYVPALKALQVQVKRGFSPAVARDVLANAHRSAGRHSELVEVLETRISEGDVTDTLGAVHFELARVRADFLGDASGAWPHAVDAYKDTPGGDEGLRRRQMAVAIARRAGQQDELVEVLLAAAASLATPEERQERRALDRQVLQAQGASRAILARFWRAILDDDPRHEQAIAEVEAYARESGSIQALADLLNVRAEGALDDEERRQLRGELARLYIDNDRPRQAVSALEGILSEDPSDAEAFEMLARLYDQLREAAELADLLERRLSVAPGDDIPALKERLAGTWWHGLDDTARAVEIYGELCQTDNVEPTVVRALESMWGEGLERESLFELLAPIYENNEDWERLVALLGGVVDVDGALDLKADALSRKATIEKDKLGRPASAYSSIKTLVKLVLEADRPGEMAAHSGRLESLATETNNWTDLLKFYEGVAASGAGDAAFASRLGSLWADKGQDPERAIAAHRLALSRDPHTAASRDALTELLTSAQRWEELAAHLGGSAETHLDIADKLAAYQAQARILRGRLGRPAEAVEALQRAVAVGLDNSIYEELARILGDLGRHADLQAHYRDWREKVQSDEEARRIQVRLALSLIEAEQTVRDAVSELEDVLSAAPGDGFALDALVEVLDRADAMEAAGQSLTPNWKAATAQAAEAVERGLEQLGGDVTPAQQAAAVRAKLRGTGNPAERLPLLRQLGELQVKAKRAADAFKSFAEALPLAPMDTALMAELERLAEQQGLQGRLLAVFVACFQAGSRKGAAADQQQTYALKVGSLLFRGLGRRVEAAPYLETYVASNETDVAALRMLAESYREAERGTDEARILGMVLEHVSDTDRVDVGKRLGVLRLDVLGDTEGAMAAFDAAMPTAAQDPDIARRLEALYGKAANFDGLARVYDAALSADPEMEVRLQLLAKKSQIHEMRLSNLDIASQACRSMLELKPNHRFALTSLTRIEEKREDWASLETVLQQRMPGALNNKERIQILSKRAEVLATRLERPAEALELAQKANDLDNLAQGSEGLVTALQGLLEHEGERGKAAALLEPRLAARKDWAGLTEALRVQAETATIPLEKVKLAVRTSQIQEAKLGQKVAALETLGGTLKALVDDEVRAGQLRKQVELTAKRTGLWDDAARIASDLAKDVPEAKKALYVRWLGRIERDGLKDLERAIGTFEELRALTNNDPAVTAELETLYRVAGRSDKLRELLDERLSELPEEDRPRALLDMTYVLVDQEGFPGVIPLLEQVLELDPRNIEARQLLMNALSDAESAGAAAAVLEPKLREAGQWAELVAVLAARARVTDDLGQRARVLEAMGDTYLTELESPQKAFAAYARALDDDSSANDILGKLGRATAALGAWKEYTQVLQLVISREDNHDRKRDLFLQLAQIVEVRLGHVDKAAQIMQAAYNMAPYHPGVVTTFVRLQRKLGRTAEVVKLAEAGMDNIEDAKIRLRLWHEVYEAAVGDRDQKLAIRAAEQCLEIDPYDFQSAERLMPLYEQQHRYQELEQLLMTQADGAMDSTREASLMLRLGKLRETALKDVAAAVQAYASALDLNPGLNEAASLLERHYRDQERFGELFDVLAKRAESLPPGGQESVATYMEMARLAEDQLDDLDQAIAAYEKIVSFETGDQLALDQLIRICHRNKRYDRLAELYELKGRMQKAPADRRHLMVLAAEVYAVRLRNMVKAEGLLDQVRSEDPDNPKASVVLAQIQAERGDPARAVTLLERLLATTTGPARFDILLNIGRLHKEKLDAPDKALGYLTQARQLQASNVELNALLSEMFKEAGDSEGLKGVLTSQYESTKNPRERYEAALSLARLHSELGDGKGFLEWVDKAQEDGRQRREVVELLIDHYSRMEDWPQVVARLEWLVNYLEGKKLTAELPARARQLASRLEQLGDTDKALQYYKLAVSADSRDIDSLRGFGRLQMARKDWAKALKTHQSLIMLAGKTGDTTLNAEVLLNLAKCSIGTGNKPKAKQYLKRLLGQSPDHAEGKKLLADVS